MKGGRLEEAAHIFSLAPRQVSVDGVPDCSYPFTARSKSSHFEQLWLKALSLNIFNLVLRAAMMQIEG